MGFIQAVDANGQGTCGADDDTLGALSCSADQIAKFDGSVWTCADDLTGAAAAAWLLGGNAGTTPGTNFLGTTDAQPLEIKVNGARVMRYESASAPNILGGSFVNTVTSGVQGATIAGGGTDDDGFGTPRPNKVTDDLGTVGGGWNNVAGNNDGDPENAGSSTVGGGVNNTASGVWSTVGGGDANTASGVGATVGGGSLNVVSGSLGTVGGGQSNTASGSGGTVGGGDSNTASRLASTVGGGGDNTASGERSTVAGGAFGWASGEGSTVGGGRSNTASGAGATVGGGFLNFARFDGGTTVGGGLENLAGREFEEICANGVDDDGDGFQDEVECSVRALYATVGGGLSNTASGWAATVGGGESNEASGGRATVGGGESNAASKTSATVGGGFKNTASGALSTVGGGRLNSASELDSTVGGGVNNTASDTSATVSGGDSNTASKTSATVGGGTLNEASGDESTVGGGTLNKAGGFRATVGGGRDNQAQTSIATVGGGSSNLASGVASTVGGGSNNQATGNQATVAGGTTNKVIGNQATVGGGQENRATAIWAFVGGGVVNVAGDEASVVAGGQNNNASSKHSSVGGGTSNKAEGEAATVSGGDSNEASNTWATVGGGLSNTASGSQATVGGGGSNLASGFLSTVAGGDDNTAGGIRSTVGGGVENAASGFGATVGGGVENAAGGVGATVPGGSQNTASGDHSFAAGRHAEALHDGAFVWSDDSSATPFASTGLHQFLIDADGGVGIGTNAPSELLHVADGGAIKIGETPLAAGEENLLKFGDGDFTYMGERGADDEMEMHAKYWNFTFSGFGLRTALEVGRGGVCIDDDGHCTPPANGHLKAFVIDAAGHSDLAEVYPSDDALQPGELVSFDPLDPGKVRRADGAYDAGLMSVVSTAPGMVLGTWTDQDLAAAGVLADLGVGKGEALEPPEYLPGTYPIALAGRVPVKVSGENGPVLVGDPLTSSSVPGVAMKAAGPGPIVGRALSAFDGLGVGEVEMFVQPGWHGGAASADGAASGDGAGALADPDVAGVLQDQGDQIAELRELIEELQAINDGLAERLSAFEAAMAP